MLLTKNFEMTDRRRRRRLKVVPRAAADFVRQLKTAVVKVKLKNETNHERKEIEYLISRIVLSRLM